MKAKDISKEMEKLFKSIKDDETLIPKAREMNKAIHNMISHSKAQIEYNKMMNRQKKIDLLD